MAIKLEDGVLEEGGEAGGCERRSQEEGVEEAAEQLEVTHLPPFPFRAVRYTRSLYLVSRSSMSFVQWHIRATLTQIRNMEISRIHLKY